MFFRCCFFQFIIYYFYLFFSFFFLFFFLQKEVFSPLSCFVNGAQGQTDEKCVLKTCAERNTVKRTEKERWSCLWSVFTGVCLCEMVFAVVGYAEVVGGE